MNRTGTGSILSVGLVFLLVLQMNALPVHEYNLRQAGYTLVNVQPWEAGQGSGQRTITSRDKNFYNIASCETHFRLNLLQQFQEFFAGLVLAGSFLLALEYIYLSSSFFRYDRFLASLSSRAPPVSG